MDLDNVKNSKPVYLSQKANFLDVNRVLVQTPSSMMRCHYHSWYEIYYINKGERLYFIKDKLYHISEGDMVFISPNEIHATLNETSNGYDRTLINFDKKFIQSGAYVFDDINFFEIFDDNIAVISFDGNEKTAIEKLLLDMLAEYDGERLAGKLRLMILELLRQVNLNKVKCVDSGLNRPSYVHKTIADVVGYINNNYESELRLEDVANHFFISPCYLSRAFKKTVNISFVDYVNNVRIMEAKKLLTSTDKSVLEIGESVGFRSNTHFGRIFRKISGTSPLKFRKNVRGTKQ